MISDSVLSIRCVGYPRAVRRVLYLERDSLKAVSEELVRRSLIAQNAYCSRDIYFQFNKVRRSVIKRGDSMKALQPLVAKNARRSSLICCSWQTKQ